jgi:hypothetical protein
VSARHASPFARFNEIDNNIWIMIDAKMRLEPMGEQESSNRPIQRMFYFLVEPVIT